MDDDLDDYKLDTTFHPETNSVVHTSWTQDRARGLRKVRVEDRWYRKQCVGVGGCGSVHLEVMESGDQRAVKKISKRLVGECGIDYKKELAALSLLSRNKFRQHQLFAEFLGWFEDNGAIFLAMEYFPHSDLGKYLNGEIKEKDARVISRQLLEGLQILHSKGFTHRDMKPQNIFVVQISPSWWVKIGDFGITKRVKSDTFTQLRTEIGTPGYEAPEIRDGDSSNYTNAVDIWSFGCVIYELMALELPFLSRAARQKFCDGKMPFSDGPLEGKMSTEGIEFLKSALIPNPSLRPNAATALNAAWLISDQIVVGIDFGMEYCVVSWVVSYNMKDINIITSWPNSELSRKRVPSTISYINSKVENWGHSCKFSKSLRVFTVLAGHDRPEALASHNVDPPPISRQDMLADYINRLWQHTLHDIRRSVSKAFFHTAAIKAVIAPPDGLSESIRNVVRTAARVAGIPENIEMIVHSEATALSLIEDVAAGGTWTDKTFIICEATERTVNVSAYTIEQMDPPKLRGTVAGVGDRCGSSLIDAEFEKYIAHLVGQKEYKNIHELSRRHMMGDFGVLKAYFQEMDEDIHIVDLFGIDDNQENGINDGTITLSRGVIKALFDDVLLGIKAVLDTQITAVKKKAKGEKIEAILIFGDFQPFQYLVDCAENWYRADGISVLGIDAPETAASRGAAMAGMANRGEMM